MCRGIYRDRYLKELIREVRAGRAGNVRRGIGWVAACRGWIAAAARNALQKKPPAEA